MTVSEAVVLRLAMLGYTVTDSDNTGLAYLISRCEQEILSNINQRCCLMACFTRWLTWLPVNFFTARKPQVSLTGWRALTSLRLQRAFQRAIFPLPLPVPAMARQRRRHGLMRCWMPCATLRKVRLLHIGG